MILPEILILLSVNFKTKNLALDLKIQSTAILRNSWFSNVLSKLIFTETDPTFIIMKKLIPGAQTF